MIMSITITITKVLTQGIFQGNQLKCDLTYGRLHGLVSQMDTLVLMGVSTEDV